MAFDLSDVLDNMKAAVNPPGVDLFPDATDDDWLLREINAFWEARLSGLLEKFVVDDDGVITPIAASGADISREEVQLVIFFAAMETIYQRLGNLRTQFRAKAGPVEYETQQAATLLRDVLANLIARKNIIMTRLSDVGSSTTDYINAVTARTVALAGGFDYWLSAGSDPGARGGMG